MFESDIWVGDLVKGLEALSPANEFSSDVIAGLLGVGTGRGVNVTPKKETQVEPDSGAHPVAGAAKQAGVSEPADTIDDIRVEGSPRSQNAALDLEEVLRPVATEPAVVANRWEAVEPLEPPEVQAASFEPAHEPLFDPRWHREIAAAATAQLLPLGLVDVRTLVERAARGLPVVRVPRKQRWSVNRGVQLLIDGGRALEPFRKDQSAFASVVRSVVGAERVEVVEFEHAPLRGVFDSASGLRRAYRPPAAGVPIVVLSDLGQSGPIGDGMRATVQEWQAFAEAVSRASPRVVAFVPLPPDLIPESLRSAVGAVYWNRTTAHRHIREVSRAVADRSSPASPVGQNAAIQSLARDRTALATELAQLVSPAVFVEPELLRAMRLVLLPAAGPEIESAVWFGPDVRARNPSGIVFHAHAAASLRNRLRDSLLAAPNLRPRLLRARDVMEHIHDGQSAALRLEERLAWRVAMGDVGGAERELERALKAHAAGGRPGIAAWASEAWRRLPAEARYSRSGWVFHQLARTTARGRGLPAVARPAALRPEDISAALDIVPDVKFGVRRRHEMLELGNLSGEGAVAIMVPDTEPRALDVLRGADEDRTEVIVHSHERAELEVGRGPLRLRTLRGHVYELRAVRPSTPESQQERVPESPPSPGTRWSWGYTWPAWELNFDEDGTLLNPATLDDVAFEDVTDIFVFVHGWNVERVDARDLYSRLMREPSARIQGGVAGKRRFGAIGVFWPSTVWSAEDDEPASVGFDEHTVREAESQLADLEREMTPDQKRRFADASQRLAAQPDDRTARAQVRAVERELSHRPAESRQMHEVEETSRGSGLFGGLWSSTKNLIRLTTYYGMRARAGKVGHRGLATAIDKLGQRATDLRFHVIAHSVGARLATYALHDRSRGSNPVKSLVLLQGVLAQHAFAPSLPSNRSRAGALAVVTQNVDGPVIVTHSYSDRAAGLAYELLTRLGGGDDDTPGERAAKAMGHTGAQGVSAMSVELGPIGTAYRFEPGRVINVDGSSFINDHGDVTGPEIAWLILSAAGAASLYGSESDVPQKS